MQRWHERFAGRDMRAELAVAKPPTKSRLRHLLANLPHRYGNWRASGGHFLISAAASPPAVFVVAPKGLVITVYPLCKTEFKLY
jgi:hypothetical protein